MKPAQFFSEADQQRIIAAIQEAEKNTSGEIRVHIEKKCGEDPVKHAGKVFQRLGMHKTALRNGVLFFLAPESHSFALIGDIGIHQKVGQEFWNCVRDKTIEKFREGKFAEGLCEGILECGQQLKKYFPYQEHKDKNELSDDISFS